MKKRTISVGSDGKGQIQNRSEQSGELAKYPDAYVFILLDCSWSMTSCTKNGETKMDAAKRGCIKYAKEAIEKGYAIGIIAFAGRASLISHRQIRNVPEVAKLINKIQFRDSTNFTPPLEMATDLLRGLPGQRVIFLITDGQSEPPSTRGSSLAAARVAKENGIHIITRGTEDADHEFLKTIASSIKYSLAMQTEKMEEGIAETAALLPTIPEGRRLES